MRRATSQRLLHSQHLELRFAISHSRDTEGQQSSEATRLELPTLVTAYCLDVVPKGALFSNQVFKHLSLRHLAFLRYVA